MINPSTGEEVLTKLDDATASEIAKAGKGIFINGAASSAVNDIDKKMDELEQGEFSRKTFSPQSEQFPVFAWIALLLLVTDTIVVTRKISWLKKYRFFSKEEEGGNK